MQQLGAWGEWKKGRNIPWHAGLCSPFPSWNTPDKFPNYTRVSEDKSLRQPHRITGRLRPTEYPALSSQFVFLEPLGQGRALSEFFGFITKRGSNSASPSQSLECVCDLPLSFYTCLSNILFDSHNNPVRHTGNIMPISQVQIPRQGDEMFLAMRSVLKKPELTSTLQTPIQGYFQGHRLKTNKACNITYYIDK